MRIGDYLAQYPATDKLGHLFPGSWIQHNFGIWIGHPECNRAWDALYETRQYLTAATARKSKPAEQLARAWEELYIAEGSDWFWWFGDSHSSAQDGLFDRLFRKHLQNVYLVLDEQPPSRIGPAHQPGPPPADSIRRADRPAEREDRRAAELTSSGSTPGTTSAAAPAAR